MNITQKSSRSPVAECLLKSDLCDVSCAPDCVIEEEIEGIEVNCGTSCDSLRSHMKCRFYRFKNLREMSPKEADLLNNVEQTQKLRTSMMEETVTHQMETNSSFLAALFCVEKFIRTWRISDPIEISRSITHPAYPNQRSDDEREPRDFGNLTPSRTLLQKEERDADFKYVSADLRYVDMIRT